ncbi:hypothetical protein [Streptomyces sp. MI02-7b]|uniref:hypothetical protein n=1 Tax=Streptomyces sp. MI02-7b TaxID=462941 RepID=UPI0029A012B9|nr:hypothetical protein [Streptomyces sp. MI02-7b]MDX3074635.1 hypothetical protein [Streptomyces sp. MI02-7b]
MKRRTARNARWLALGIYAIVLAGALGWRATGTVEPYCAYSFGYITTVDGQVMGPDGKPTTVEELAAKAYQHAYESGACEKPHSRWHDWVD